MTSRPFKKVLIIGAGPSGLLLAVLLAQHGIPIEILEAEDHLNDQPRAAVYGSPAIPEFVRAGLMDEIKARGIILNSMCWRDPDTHEVIAGFDSERVLRDVEGMDLRAHTLVLQDLVGLMLERVVGGYGGTVRWRHRVVGVGQDGERAWVECETPEGRRRVEGDYVVGCDGANSGVRKGLFGEEFPGFTWDAQIIATNTYYDFEKFGWKDANFIIHPEHFFMATRITKDNLYRITYGEKASLTKDEYVARQPWKFEHMLPGHPKPSEYTLVGMSPYKMHQRCAPSFRVGRVLLAADAAHICNPWGGLGITGGFVDIGGLYDCLAGIWDGKADESILDLYSEKRIEKWKTVIDPISQENFRRVRDADPKTRFERDEFMQMLKKGETDDAYLKELLLGFNAVRYDFTQHYKKAGNGKETRASL